MIKIVLDTNFLIDLLKYRIRLEDELKRLVDGHYRVYILDRTIDELNGIVQRQTGKNKQLARMALQMVNGKELIKSEGSVDDFLEKLAVKGYIIATGDKILKKALKKCPVLLIRQKKYLVIKNTY